MPTLLVVHHTPSPAMQGLLEAAREGVAMAREAMAEEAGAEEAGAEGAGAEAELELVERPALSAGAADLLAADGVLLGTPANIGYMSGALKHFFDTVYYPCLDATVGLKYALYVHGNDDTAGALTAIGKITGAFRWEPVAEPLSLIGTPGREELEAVRELSATLAVSL